MDAILRVMTRPEPLMAMGILLVLGTLWIAPRLTLEQTLFGFTLAAFQFCSGYANWLSARNHRFAPMLSMIAFLLMIALMVLGIVVLVRL